MEIDHKIFSMVILSLLLIQKGQLSVSGERICISTGQPLRTKPAQEKVWLGKLTALDMTQIGLLVQRIVVEESNVASDSL